MNNGPTDPPPLKPIHPESSLSPAKLARYEKLSSDELKQSLAPGQINCLKTKPDGTILDGHHRIHVLRGRSENVDTLPREILEQSKELYEAAIARRRQQSQHQHDKDK